MINTIPVHRHASWPDSLQASPQFDAKAMPILAVHWFGCLAPVEPSAEIDDRHLMRLAAALHRLGEGNGFKPLKVQEGAP